ncbi:MAG: hypothetical protein WC342_08880 [Methanoregula sp.]|jgi:hypothetical protein
MDAAGVEMLRRFGEKFPVTGLTTSPDVMQELTVFDDFLEEHVQKNRICSVQCMLLWNEWVLSFRRRISGFPRLIHEQEFRNVVTDRFGVGIVRYESLGEVYPGIKFVS